MVLLKKKTDHRDVFLSMLSAQDRKILDVGCGSGALGAKLVAQGKEVVGMEQDARLSDQASRSLTKVITGDACQQALPFEQGYFDAIIYADVLEHLVDPLALLRQQRKYLKPQGEILVSLPNIRYYKVMDQVFFKGVWDYTDAGILDKTHLRFFTLVTMKELLARAGYEIVDMQRHIVASSFYKGLSALLLGAGKDLLTYQYYFKARKVETPVAVALRKIVQF